MTRNNLMRLAASLWLLLCGTRLALAAPSTLSGTVSDVLGRPLGGVSIDLTDLAGAVLAHGTTVAAGHFDLPCPPPGHYSVKFTLAGYEPDVEPVEVPLAQPLAITLDAAEQVVTVKTTVASGPRISPAGANEYTVTSHDVDAKPNGDNSTLSQVLQQMPGVALDQNQEIHLRGQHNVGQYQLNGVLVPLDMYADPSFVNFLNPTMIRKLDLVTGVLPAQYGFSNVGGVIAIDTKTGKDMQGGEVTLEGGQRGTLQPSIQYGAGNDDLDYFFTAQYLRSDLGFSSATPGPTPIHDRTSQFQGFGQLNWRLSDTLKMSAMLAGTDSGNQLPDVPGLTPRYSLRGVGPYPSSAIASDLSFRDVLGVLSLQGTPSSALHWQVAAAAHSLTQDYRPDTIGELVYQGVAATTRDLNHDVSLQGDVAYTLQRHTLGAGFYVGHYGIETQNSSLVFPVEAGGLQTSLQPRRIENDFNTSDTLTGVYVNDLWHLSPVLSANLGLRYDAISGFTSDSSIDPTLNLIYRPSGDITVHVGWAHYMDAPRMQAFAPGAQASFIGTSNAQPPGQVAPFAQRDQVFDGGVSAVLTPRLSLAFDAYFERNSHYSDEGQFGAVPIFVGFNYGHGSAWGTEYSIKYQQDHLSLYGNLSVGRSYQYGVSSGQFNFTPAALAFIDAHGLVLDHEPLFAATAGLAWRAGRWLVSLEELYSSGLRAGFADTLKLPADFQVNLGVERSFGRFKNRVTILNLFDRVNLIRPANGIGVFQSAYGPRFTVLDTVRFLFGEVK